MDTICSCCVVTQIRHFAESVIAGVVDKSLVQEDAENVDLSGRILCWRIRLSTSTSIVHERRRRFEPSTASVPFVRPLPFARVHHFFTCTTTFLALRFVFIQRLVQLHKIKFVSVAMFGCCCFFVDC
jgi:hypothetical protein